MANEKNLRPGSMQSKSEVRENGRKGGIASGQARRRKKTLSELAKMIADNPAPDNARAKLAKMGISDEDANNNAVVAASIYAKHCCDQGSVGGAIMRDIKDLCARIEDELSKIADNGLTTGNLEMTYKLIDMYKDIKNTYYWDKKVEYYNTVLDEMRSGYNDDYSERGRKRDSMGRYSSNDGRMMPDYDRGSSYARRGEHYVRGHYSRSDGRDAYDDYMTQKQSYRSGKSEDCKRKMLAALEEHLDELTTEMSDMSKDAECREERDLVKRYVEKLRDML